MKRKIIGSDITSIGKRNKISFDIRIAKYNNIVRKVISENSIEKIQWLLSDVSEDEIAAIFHDCMREACKSQNLEMACWLFTNSEKISQSSLKDSYEIIAFVFIHNIKIARYLYQEFLKEKSPIPKDHEYLIRLLDQDHFKTLQDSIHAGEIHGTGALIQCIRFSEIDSLKYLLQHGLDINKPIFSLLITAIKMNNMRMVRFLINYGADVNGMEGLFFKLTPIYHAFQQHNFTMVEYLIHRGADIKDIIPKLIASNGNKWENDSETLLYMGILCFNHGATPITDKTPIPKIPGMMNISEIEKEKFRNRYTEKIREYYINPARFQHVIAKFIVMGRQAGEHALPMEILKWIFILEYQNHIC